MDIRAGKAAGTLTVGVLSGLASRRQLEAEAPNALLEDITGLLTLMDVET
jgi:phosphoglycolate phosphatase-like HAD superfamily hydrolase